MHRLNTVIRPTAGGVLTRHGHRDTHADGNHLNRATTLRKSICHIGRGMGRGTVGHHHPQWDSIWVSGVAIPAGDADDRHNEHDGRDGDDHHVRDGRRCRVCAALRRLDR